MESYKRNATVEYINGLTQKSVGDVYITENGGTVILGKQGRFLVAKGTPLVWRGSYWEILEGYDPKSTYATKEELQSEASQRGASDVSLGERIDSIVMDYAKKEYVDTKVSAETTRAMEEEASLQTQINGKASQEALETETAAREAADTQLQYNIDSEASRAEAAESALGTRIDGVENDVEALDTRLTTAESDIDTLESGLSAETEARESADSTLQTNIDNEATARENADNALDTRLTTAESDIDSLESSVDALYNTEVEQTDGETSVSSSTSGKVKTFVVGLASAIKTKIEAAYSHISDAVKHITATERTNWNTAYTHSQTEGNPHGTTIEEIGGLRTELTTIESDVSAIEGVIPSEATTTNQLADKAFVNSSITTNTATFRGTSAKNLTEAQFLAWANSLTKTKNDYCFWDTTDSDGNVVFKRYKWNDVQWEYEYTLNNSSFTAAQWAAIQSGITAEDVADIGYNTTARHTHANKNLLDTYTQSNASLADAVAKKHEHANKDVLDDTTASYTSEEKTKLEGIESGAEVNVNADWNATSGDAQILNKPSTFPPSSHTHTIGDVTGILPITKGGTGATSAPDARTNLDVYSKSETDNKFVSYVTNNGVNVAGNVKNVSKTSPETLFVNNGLIMGGTAAKAGLVTRGICGVTTPAAANGACSKENLYVNYDGDGTYKAARQLIIQAGEAGTHYGNNLYQYAAARGDAVKGFCDSTYATKSEIPDVSGKENTSNKVTTLDNSTTHYPSTSAVTTALNGKANANGSNASGDWAISTTKGKIVSRTDFDALTTSGTYEILIEEEEELTNSNHPPTEGTTAVTCRGFIEVRNVGGTTNAIIQQATYNVGYIGTRRRQNNAWTSWERITYIPNGTAVGSPTQPVYVDVQGAVQACTGSNLVATSNQNITPTKAQLEANQYFLYRNNNATTYNLNIDADLLVDGKVYSITLVGDSSVTPNRTWNVRFKSSGGVANTYSDYANYSVSTGTLTTSFQNVEISTTWRNKQVVRKGSSVYIFGY